MRNSNLMSKERGLAETRLSRRQRGQYTCWGVSIFNILNIRYSIFGCENCKALSPGDSDTGVYEHRHTLELLWVWF